jgi:hypothetical protein
MSSCIFLKQECRDPTFTFTLHRYAVGQVAETPANFSAAFEIAYPGALEGEVGGFAAAGRGPSRCQGRAAPDGKLSMSLLPAGGHRRTQYVVSEAFSAPPGGLQSWPLSCSKLAPSADGQRLQRIPQPAFSFRGIKRRTPGPLWKPLRRQTGVTTRDAVRGINEVVRRWQ